MKLFKRRPRIEEIDAEMRAQIILSRKRGVDVQYVDTHYMGMDSYSGLREVIQKIAKDFDLPISSQMGERWIGGIYRVPVKEKKERALDMLEKLSAGLWLWNVHIGIDSPEQGAFIHTRAKHQFKNGGVGPHRAEELSVISDTK